MVARAIEAKPALGTTVAVKRTADEQLAGIPAQVIYVWPRFRSGEYLVTLEYARPVQVGNDITSRIDVFVTELELLGEPQMSSRQHLVRPEFVRLVSRWLSRAPLAQSSHA
jgi:hypothetical protein